MNCQFCGRPLREVGKIYNGKTKTFSPFIVHDSFQASQECLQKRWEQQQ